MKMNSLPLPWQLKLSEHIDLTGFFKELNEFLFQFPVVIPNHEFIFNVFNFLKPGDVKVVVFGEDPYPRLSSAQGVAFWDAELIEWTTKTSGNCVRNLMKALLVAKGDATYDTPLADCRLRIKSYYESPSHLFEQWLANGIFLLNSALTFSSSADKKAHFKFWQPFIDAVISTLCRSETKPFFILWGRKARQWLPLLEQLGISEDRIISQNHPTFIHQFLDKEKPRYSPFSEIIERSQIKWI